MITLQFYVSPDMTTFYVSPELKRAIAASITPQKREEIRMFLIGTLMQVMRDEQDPAIRRDAYDVLLSVLPKLNGWSVTDYMPGRWGDN